jgi:xylulokinase
VTAPYVIGCDVGSQGTNAALYAADGRLVASAYEAYDVAFPHPGWAEQDPRLWTAAVAAGIARLLAEVPEGPAAVRALSFGSQLDGMVVCDAGGEPLRPAMIWMDRRAEPQAAALAARLSPPTSTTTPAPTWTPPMPCSRPCGSATPSPRCSPRPPT